MTNNGASVREFSQSVGKSGASTGKVEQRVPTICKLCGEHGNGGDWRRDNKEPKQRCGNEAVLVGIGEKIGVGRNRGKGKGETVEIRKR